MATATGDRCPTQPDILPQLLALLPRGRAWGTAEGGPLPDSILVRFWNSVASVFEFANKRICDLREEFFCATQVETRDLWLAEYGLPDACDPFPDLCAKVSALGGSRCDYFAAVASRAGWSIACIQPVAATIGCMMLGCSPLGKAGDVPVTLRIRITLASSPAYGGPTQRQWMFGRSNFGQPLACGPDIGPLTCLLERILPAHAAVIYEVV